MRLVGGVVYLLLSGPAPPPPELWLDEGSDWVLPGSTPLPTLAAVGSRSGRHLLLDLERLGGLTISGDPRPGHGPDPAPDVRAGLQHLGLV